MRLEKSEEANLQALKMIEEFCFWFALFSFQEAFGGIRAGSIHDSGCAGKGDQMPCPRECLAMGRASPARRLP